MMDGRNGPEHGRSAIGERQRLCATLGPRDGRVSAREAQAHMAGAGFIGMLKDGGLCLDDIAGILGAPSVHEWKAIATRRLGALNDEIAGLERARSYLEGALLCRFDHPVTECAIMGTEMCRRLGADNG